MGHPPGDEDQDQIAEDAEEIEAPEMPGPRRDGNDLLAQFRTWELSDISDNPRYQGDLSAALGAITARTVLMPGRTDLYFTPEDIEADAQAIPGAQYIPIESIYGHRAGNPTHNKADQVFIASIVDTLLNDAP